MSKIETFKRNNSFFVVTRNKIGKIIRVWSKGKAANTSVKSNKEFDDFQKELQESFNR